MTERQPAVRRSEFTLKQRQHLHQHPHTHVQRQTVLRLLARIVSRLVQHAVDTLLERLKHGPAWLGLQLIALVLLDNLVNLLLGLRCRGGGRVQWEVQGGGGVRVQWEAQGGGQSG